MIRLGFHYHIPAIQKSEGIFTPGYQGRFIDSLAKYCQRLICFLHSPSTSMKSFMDYRISASNVVLVNIGPQVSVPIRMLKSRQYSFPLFSFRNEMDVMLLRGPSPLLPAMAHSVDSLPVALLLVADYIAGIDDLPQPLWRKELIRIWARWNQHQQMYVAKRSLVFVNSRLLYEQLHQKVPNLIETRTTTLIYNDFYQRTDTCQTAPYRLLYTGRLTRMKGLFEIVKALSQLVNSGFNVVLDIVGMPERNDPVLNEISNLAHSLGLGERVQYHGYKAAGHELLAYYRRADIYVIASQASSEGFPRTIWEAMASSLPVVATEVGSIPAFIGDAAVLVPPKHIDALTQAIRDLLTTPTLRQRLIKKGMVLAQSNTLNKRAEEMVTKIEHWLEIISN